MNVFGRAPDGLTWELGLRPWFPPLMVFTPEGARSGEGPDETLAA